MRVTPKKQVGTTSARRLKLTGTEPCAMGIYKKKVNHINRMHHLFPGANPVCKFKAKLAQNTVLPARRGIMPQRELATPFPRTKLEQNEPEENSGTEQVGFVHPLPFSEFVHRVTCATRVSPAGNDWLGLYGSYGEEAEL